jgi:hypothetical protein
MALQMPEIVPPLDPNPSGLPWNLVQAQTIARFGAP